MSFNSVNQYSASHKVWDHVGNIIPDVEHSEGERPAHEFKPASWLPVKFFDKHYENWVVVMPGKLVSLDPDGRLMPAEYGLTGASVVYAQNDVDAGTIDVATGAAVTTTKTVLLAALTGAKGTAWTAALAGTANNTSYRSGFMGRFGVEFADTTAKYPIGVAPYAYLKWAGGADGDGWNPATLTQHNYNMQHQVAVLCDYVIKLPLVPGQEATETVDKTVGGDLVIGTQATHTRTSAQANARYNATTGTVPVANSDTVIALALDNYPIAKNTARSTITIQSDNTADDVTSILVNERTSIASVSAAGDFYVDQEAGVIFIYSANGATVPTAISAAAGTVSCTYYWYGVATGTASQFASVVSTTTTLKPGDFLKCGTNSNFVRADPASDTLFNVIGQVIAIDSDYPRDYLDRVRTAYSPAISTDASGSMANATAGSSSVGVGQLDQMPGSANGGYPDLISYSGAADTIVLINLISR